VTRHVRVFRRGTEKLIERRFGIVRPTTDAVRLLPAGQQNTDRWLAARSATIGASEISILMMDEHPYHSPFSLWHVKAHGWGQHAQTNAQERGHLLEPGAARRFADAHPDLIVARPNGGLWRDPSMPALSCTPDYLTINADGLIVPLELKSDEGGGDWGAGPEEIPAHVWWQSQQQQGVFAAPYGYVARWNSRGYHDYLIAYDHDRYSKAGEVAAGFLADVAAGRCPTPDGHRTSIAVLTDIDPVFAVAPVEVPSAWGGDLAALKESRKQLDKQIKTIEACIRERLGPAPVGWDDTGRLYQRKETLRRGYTVAPGKTDQVRIVEPDDRED
jgi:predicted phage-related endonuclease